MNIVPWSRCRGPQKERLLAFASVTGLVVIRQMMGAELTGRVGTKDAKIPPIQRIGNWHGSTTGSAFPSPCSTRPRTRPPPRGWPKNSRPAPRSSARADDRFRRPTSRRQPHIGGRHPDHHELQRVDDLNRKQTTSRMTEWKHGSMKTRWVASGLLEAERSFRRVRGHRTWPG